MQGVDRSRKSKTYVKRIQGIFWLDWKNIEGADWSGENCLLYKIKCFHWGICHYLFIFLLFLQCHFFFRFFLIMNIFPLLKLKGILILNMFLKPTEINLQLVNLDLNLLSLECLPSFMFENFQTLPYYSHWWTC